MILRRLANSFRKQDWFTVVIETLIVVLGVFLGMQANNWNEARNEHAQSVIFTAALESDLRADVDRFNAVADYYSSVRDSGERALAALEGKKTLSDEDLVINAYRASQVSIVPVNRSTFDELVSTGRINLITDRDLRATAISHYGLDYIDNAAEDGRKSDYRSLFRGTIPPAAHRAAQAACGDLDTPEVVALDYPCTLDLPPEAIAQAANELRAEPALPATLRRRINQLDVQIADMRREAVHLARITMPPEAGK